jgi:hypothetical protein
VDHLVATVSRVLETHRFRYSSERDLQTGIEQVLRAAGLSPQREAALGDAGTIDFLVDGLGIEIKVKGSRVEVTRQVHRYLQHASIAALMLVTTRAELARLPATISGKRVFTHHLTSGAF